MQPRLPTSQRQAPPSPRVDLPLPRATRRPGISSQLESTNAFCSTFVGTACYMAPERLSGGAYSYSADIWSFGLILLELLLGRYPYPAADNYFKLLSSIMDGDAPTVPQ